MLYQIPYLIFVYLMAIPTSSGEFIQKSNERSYQLDVNTSVSYYGKGVANVDLFLGKIQSNSYQKVSNSTTDSFANQQSFGHSGDSCWYYSLEIGRKTDLGKIAKVQQGVTLHVYDVKVNLDAIDSIYPYNTNSTTYTHFTSSNEPFIDLKNDSLKYLSDSLWNNSNGILDYARRCYEFVPDKFDYLDPLTGFQSIKSILENGGGDCGNLSTIFINLLRIKGIPARHIVGFRPDTSLHVWAEFYLEKYGWIPLDVTYKQSDPEGDYFGTILFENNGFILHHGIGNLVFKNSGPVRIPSLQTFSYDESYANPGSKKVHVSREVSCELK